MPPRHFLHRLPAHMINGLGVATGIALVQLIAGGMGGMVAALTASSGAVFASLADVPNATQRTAYRVFTGALIGCITSVLIALVAAHPVTLGFVTGVLGCGSAFMLAWGARAGAISFVPILALVFTMAAPPLHGLQPILVHAGWTTLGAVLYLGWAVFTSRLLQPRYRSLATANALRATAELLRSRAVLLGDDPMENRSAAPPLQAWIERQVSLDERLQAARDLLFAAPEAPGVPLRITLLLLAIDMRDTLVASELDLDLLARDAPGEAVRGTLATTMRSMARAIDDMADALRDGSSTLPSHDADAASQTVSESIAPATDDAAARLARALLRRARHMVDDVHRMQAMLRSGEATPPLSRTELALFMSPEGWPLAALRAHLRWDSPVLRHALRVGGALCCAYFIARGLPWASHPHWLVLSVAVVLRGNLHQTLARRDARIAGTMLGCLLVWALAQVHTPWLATVAFIVAVGIAHSFVIQRYLVTAIAATVMALLQAHLAHPAGGFGAGERLADTLLGALLAWAFSYVLPWWERRGLNALVTRVQRGLSTLATEALRWPAPPPADLPLRFARREAYEAIGAIAAAAQRTAVEPQRVQVPMYGLATLLAQSHVLLAHLAAARSLLTRRGEELERAPAETALQAATIDLQRLLSSTSAPADADAGSEHARVDELPATLSAMPPSDDALLLWLERRLRMATYAAARAADAAQSLKAQARVDV